MHLCNKLMPLRAEAEDVSLPDGWKLLQKEWWIPFLDLKEWNLSSIVQGSIGYEQSKTLAWSWFVLRTNDKLREGLFAK